MRCCHKSWQGAPVMCIEVSGRHGQEGEQGCKCYQGLPLPWGNWQSQPSDAQFPVRKTAPIFALGGLCVGFMFSKWHWIAPVYSACIRLIFYLIPWWIIAALAGRCSHGLFLLKAVPLCCGHFLLCMEKLWKLLTVTTWKQAFIVTKLISQTNKLLGQAFLGSPNSHNF